MNAHIPWVERTFSFDFPADVYPELIERLRGAPMRAEVMARGLPREVLTRRGGTKWSIQEHIGHLADLDRATFLPRLKELEAGAEVLTPADMTNRATKDAGHSGFGIDDVVEEFAGEELLVVELFDLLKSFQGLLGRLSEDARVRLKRDTVSVTDKIQWLTELLERRIAEGTIIFPRLPEREAQYASHTYTVGHHGRIIYDKGNDHLIDADRCALLAHYLDTQEPETVDLGAPVDSFGRR